MNYEKVYLQLIGKRRKFPISKDVCYCELHHITPRSVGGGNGRDNLVYLTAKEHYVAHHLLVHWYCEKYGHHHRNYIKMLRAFEFTTHIRNGGSFATARVYDFIRRQIASTMIGKTPWNKGARGKYSEEYRNKIRESHADFSGEKNGRFGSRSVFNPETGEKKIVMRGVVGQYLSRGFLLTNQLKHFNNGEIEILHVRCPPGFSKGRLPKKHTEEEIAEMRRRASERAKEAAKHSVSYFKGKIPMVNSDRTRQIEVKREDEWKYVENGWKRGSIRDTTSKSLGRVLMINERGDWRFVSKENICDFENNGFWVSKASKTKRTMWWNDGKRNICTHKCPGEGFVKGRARKKSTPTIKNKESER